MSWWGPFWDQLLLEKEFWDSSHSYYSGHICCYGLNIQASLWCKYHANMIGGMLDRNIKQKPPYVIGAEFVSLLIAGLTMACDSSTPAPPSVPDVLATVSCTPWRPRSICWKKNTARSRGRWVTGARRTRRSSRIPWACKSRRREWLPSSQPRIGKRTASYSGSASGAWSRAFAAGNTQWVTPTNTARVTASSAQSAA